MAQHLSRPRTGFANPNENNTDGFRVLIRHAAVWLVHVLLRRLTRWANLEAVLVNARI